MDLCGSPSPTPCPSRVTQSRGHRLSCGPGKRAAKKSQLCLLLNYHFSFLHTSPAGINLWVFLFLLSLGAKHDASHLLDQLSVPLPRGQACPGCCSQASLPPPPSPPAPSHLHNLKTKEKCSRGEGGEKSMAGSPGGQLSPPGARMTPGANLM